MGATFIYCKKPTKIDIWFLTSYCFHLQPSTTNISSNISLPVDFNECFSSDFNPELPQRFRAGNVAMIRRERETVVTLSVFQLATIPQLLPGTQFPYSFSGQPIPGYYIPQPIAQAAAQAAQSSYLQGLPAGYPIGNFGVSSYPQNYIG